MWSALYRQAIGSKAERMLGCVLHGEFGLFKVKSTIDQEAPAASRRVEVILKKT
jgi:hypothetical protein